MFRKYHYLNEVFKEQSFTRAAQKLYVSQPSLSLTIKKLEDEVGIQIFDRSTSPIQLTEAGKVYMNGIRQILAIESDLKNYLEDYHELRTGSLTLGAPHMFSSYLLPTLIAQFLKQYPQITIHMVEADFPSLQGMTLNGEIDLLIESNQFDEMLFQSYPLYQEQVLLAVPLSDPINKQLRGMRFTMEEICADFHMDQVRASISLDLFREHKFLMMKKGNDMHSRSLQMCRDSGFEPDVFMYLNQLMTAYSMVNQQLGVSFMTDTIVKLSGTGKHIAFYKIANPHILRSINLAHKANHYISRPMREFISMLETVTTRGISHISERNGGGMQS